MNKSFLVPPNLQLQTLINSTFEICDDVEAGMLLISHYLSNISTESELIMAHNEVPSSFKAALGSLRESLDAIKDFIY
jgi:hypothetical protein